jgi:hypothetical protein
MTRKKSSRLGKRAIILCVLAALVVGGWMISRPPDLEPLQFTLSAEVRLDSLFPDPEPTFRYVQYVQQLPGDRVLVGGFEVPRHSPGGDEAFHLVLNSDLSPGAVTGAGPARSRIAGAGHLYGSSRDGSRLLVQGEGETIRLLDGRTLETLWILPEAKTDPFPPVLSPDGRLVALYEYDAGLRMWSTEERRLLGTHRVGPPVMLSEDGSHMIAYGGWGSPYLVEPATGRSADTSVSNNFGWVRRILPSHPLAQKLDPYVAQEYHTALAFTRVPGGGEALLVAGEQAVVWRSFGKGRVGPPRKRVRVQGPVRMLLPSADGSIVAAIGAGRIQLIHAPSARLVQSLPTRSERAAFNPDGTRLLVADGQGWDLRLSLYVRRDALDR